MSIRATLARLQERTGPIDRAIKEYRTDRARHVQTVIGASDLPGMRVATALADLASDCEERAILRRDRVSRAAIAGRI